MAFYEDNSISHSVEANAAFRAWASKIHKALEEVGLVNTADTGQINLATVETPAVSTFAGYEIWRFNDAEQEARPVYIKVEYGTGAVKTRPALRLSVGRGSNGSGTLTTASSTRTGSPTGNPEGFGYIHVCFYKGALHVFSCANTATSGINAENQPITFCIERVRNAATLVTMDALCFWGGGAAGSGPQFTETGLVFVSGSWTSCTQAVVAGGPVQEASLAPGYKVILEPVTAAPCRAMLASNAGAIGSGDTGELTIAGEAVTFKRAPVKKETVLLGGLGGGTNVSHNFLLLHQ